MEAGNAREHLVLRFAGQLVEQLGAQLYPRVTASVAELISNAWDADAKNVWVTVPFDERWGKSATIEVVDDGHGMTYEQAQERYLVVGRNRRTQDGDTSEGGRSLHGRKGIGKLAAFGTADWLECVTVRDGVTTAFAISYDKLRRHKPTDPYPTEDVPSPDPLINPITGELLASGTRVRMTGLRAKRRTGKDAFLRSMARRFALDTTKMSVVINDEPLQRFDADVEIRFPRDGTPPGVSIAIDEDGWAVETIDYSGLIDEDADDDATAADDGATAAESGGDHREVRWWIGFTAQPIPEDDVRGISILSRGKLAQRPFTFESSQGTTGQLGQEYLVGEVKADWLDHGTDANDDLIQSNRDQLQLDNAELQPLLDWGRERLRWALAQRNVIRRESHAGAGALGAPVEEIIQLAPARSRERLRTLASRIAEFTQADADGVAKAVDAVLQASDAATARRLGGELRLSGDPAQSQTWLNLVEVANSAADTARALLEARIGALESFSIAVSEPPIDGFHQRLATNAWILSPLLDGVVNEVVRADDEVAITKFGAVRPILPELVVWSWAVGVEPTSDGIAGDFAIASAWDTPDAKQLTWKEIIDLSLEAHRQLLENLDQA